MIHALDRFDTKRGNRFATYASWWIKRQIGTAIAEQFRVIRLPRRMLETIQDINKAEQNLILINGKEPTAEELAAYLEAPVARIRAIKRMASQPIYLQDSANGLNSASDLENLLENSDEFDPAKVLLRKQMQDRIKAGLTSMPERWQQIIGMHYGFNFQQPKSYEEIGTLLGISR